MAVKLVTLCLTIATLTTSCWGAGVVPVQNINKLLMPGRMGFMEQFKNLLDEMVKQGLPTEFDAREHWKECPQINEIGDQASCGSCWAFSAVSAISDRICIASKGKIQVQISALDALSCILPLGHGTGHNGCFGGLSNYVWRHWVADGLVTGGPHGDKHSCKPYPFPPCGHFTNVTNPYPPCTEQGGVQNVIGRLFQGSFKTPKDLRIKAQIWDDYSRGKPLNLNVSIHEYLMSKVIPPTPTCEWKCQKHYSSSYKDDKHFGAYDYPLNNTMDILKDIFKHGPLTAGFFVFSDFTHYKTGIYQFGGGEPVYGHAVKVVGWGIEKNLPYWIVANSWNKYWGDKGRCPIDRSSEHKNYNEQMACTNKQNDITLF